MRCLGSLKKTFTEGWIMIRIIPALILCADALADLKQKEIFPLLTVLGAAFGTAAALAAPKTDVPALAVSLLPGLIFLAVSAVSRGQIGAGDALVLFMTGAWTGLNIWRILLISLAGSALFAAVLWMIRQKNGEFPFVPFILAGFAFDTILVFSAG